MPEEEQIKADNRSIDEMLENIDKISLPDQELIYRNKVWKRMWKQMRSRLQSR